MLIKNMEIANNQFYSLLIVLIADKKFSEILIKNLI